MKPLPSKFGDSSLTSLFIAHENLTSDPMPKTIENALIEASNPQANPERLRELSEWKRKNERARLRQAIAANPNCDEPLLLELAAEYPDEVVANPRFQLLLISDEPWWEDVEPISMLQLLAELGSTAPTKARLDFFAQLRERLAGTSPLEMNQEWHMSFSHEITVEWQESAAEAEEQHEDLEECDEDPDELREQEFSVSFSGIIEENNFFLKPPDWVDDPVCCLEDLIEIYSGEGHLLGTLMEHGWEVESDDTPGAQGCWEIESITPELDGWELEADLLGDGSGSIQITDPVGETHEVEVDAPDDYGDEYLNPTLNEHPDLIVAIFEPCALSSAELSRLLREVIATEKQSRHDEANADAAL